MANNGQAVAWNRNNDTAIRHPSLNAIKIWRVPGAPLVAPGIGEYRGLTAASSAMWRGHLHHLSSLYCLFPSSSLQKNCFFPSSHVHPALCSSPDGLAFSKRSFSAFACAASSFLSPAHCYQFSGAFHLPLES